MLFPQSCLYKKENPISHNITSPSYLWHPITFLHEINQSHLHKHIALILYSSSQSSRLPQPSLNQVSLLSTTQQQQKTHTHKNPSRALCLGKKKQTKHISTFFVCLACYNNFSLSDENQSPVNFLFQWTKLAQVRWRHEVDSLFKLKLVRKAIRDLYCFKLCAVRTTSTKKARCVLFMRRAAKRALETAFWGTARLRCESRRNLFHTRAGNLGRLSFHCSFYISMLSNVASISRAYCT